MWAPSDFVPSYRHQEIYAYLNEQWQREKPLNFLWQKMPLCILAICLIYILHLSQAFQGITHISLDQLLLYSFQNFSIKKMLIISPVFFLPSEQAITVCLIIRNKEQTFPLCEEQETMFIEQSSQFSMGKKNVATWERLNVFQFLHLKKKKSAYVFTQSDLFLKTYFTVKHVYISNITTKGNQNARGFGLSILLSSCEILVPSACNCKLCFQLSMKKMHKIQRKAVLLHGAHTNVHCHLLAAVVHMGELAWETTAAEAKQLLWPQSSRGLVNINSSLLWLKFFILFCIFSSIY